MDVKGGWLVSIVYDFWGDSFENAMLVFRHVKVIRNAPLNSWDPIKLEEEPRGPKTHKKANLLLEDTKSNFLE